MKRTTTLLIAMLSVLSISAEITEPVSEMSEPEVSATETSIEATESLQEADVAVMELSGDETCTASADTLKYYKNWLGEKCIDFGEGAKTYYDWKRDFTFVGLPVFALGWSLNSDKKAFRSVRQRFIGGFHSEIDNYTQFSPYALMLGMKALGYHGRSSWDRFIVSTALSNAVMAGIVNGIKYGAKEMRPDGSTKNSFPSGHTATAFVAATILHKEYGMTRSPWFSLGGYAVATATGFMRGMNNRHWVSDIIAGAGIGILSTEVGYWLADLIYKNKGIRNLELPSTSDADHPSFFNINMGIGIHSKELEFDEVAGYDFSEKLGEYSDVVQLGTSTSLGVEGAYFFNKYIGVGGMARLTTTPVKGLDTTADDLNDLNYINNTYALTNTRYGVPMPAIYQMETSTDQLLDISFDAGIYGNLPLSRKFSLGAKFLAGCRLSKGFTYTVVPGQFVRNADGAIVNTLGNQLLTYTGNPNEPFIENGYAAVAEDKNAKSWDFIDVDGNNSFNYVVGLSATYYYKQNFAWKVFVDFDSSKNKYRMNYNLFPPTTLQQIGIASNGQIDPRDFSLWYNGKKHLNFLTIGASFNITF